MLPEFGQARAKLKCDKHRRCLRARSAFEHRIPQPPAPRGLEQIGPENFAEDALARRPQWPAFLLADLPLLPAPPAGTCSQIRWARCLPKRERRDIRAFTPVFAGYARR